MEAFLQDAKASSRVLAALSGADKNRILKEMAVALRVQRGDILKANTLDMIDAETNNLVPSLKDRFFLDEGRVDSMAVAIEEIVALKEPVGRVLDGWVTEDGLKIEKVSVPIGVIGIIIVRFGSVTEVGISTNKLHARAPMAIEGLTTYKFKIYGSGEIR